MKSGVINLETFVQSFKNPAIFEAYKKINRINDIQQHECNDLEIFSNELINLSDSNEEKLFGFHLDVVVEVAFREQFDLLRFSDNTILNIELKSKWTSSEEIHDQLTRHNYLLGCVPGHKEVLLYTFVSSEKKVYKLKDEKLVESTIEELFNSIPNDYSEENFLLGLNPDDFIISPYTDIDRFLNTRYFLNSEQKKIIEQETSNLSTYHVMIKGGAGTGKSLVLFDLAKKLNAKGKSVLLIFCSELLNWYEINEKLSFDFKDIKAVNFGNITTLNYDYILLDESQRLWKSQFESLFKTRSILIFGVDKAQTLKPAESVLDIEGQLDNVFHESKKYNLKDRVRSDVSLSTFIQKLFDKSKVGLQPINFPKVNSVYFDNILEANIFIDNLKKIEGYQSIEVPQYKTVQTGAIKNKKINPSSLDGFKVIGREFDNVLIPIDNRVSYSNNKLTFTHGENYYPYLSVNGLFQAITRVKNNLLFVIIGNVEIYKEIQKLITWKNDKNYLYVALRLKRLREITNTDVYDISKACKCSRETYENIENTGVFPNNKILQKLSIFYNLSSEFLIGEPTQLSYTDFDILYQLKSKGKSKIQRESINKQLLDFLKEIE
ncbi:DNA/RNA helicase domain-containing protein [Enterococcus casseliflavus]